MAKRDRNRQHELRSFRNLCETTGFGLEPHQVKIAGGLLGIEREKLITLPRKNGRAAWSARSRPIIC